MQLPRYTLETVLLFRYATPLYVFKMLLVDRVRYKSYSANYQSNAESRTLAIEGECDILREISILGASADHLLTLSDG